MQHLRALETGDQTYPMVKHMEAEHPLVQASSRIYTTSILGGAHIKGNLTWYITETQTQTQTQT